MAGKSRLSRRRSLSIPFGERGFTLAEVVVVLVIAGLILVMALQGVGMLGDAREQRFLRDIDAIETAFRTYRERYRALPGDDPAAPDRFGRPPSGIVTGMDEDGNPVVSGPVGNRRIEGRFTATGTPYQENFMAWSDLRHADLLPGNPAVYGPQAQPENVFGGIIGFDEQAFGLPNPVLCFTRVPGLQAMKLERARDDGPPDTGRIRAAIAPGASGHYDTPDVGRYNPQAVYTVCMTLS